MGNSFKARFKKSFLILKDMKASFEYRFLILIILSESFNSDFFFIYFGGGCIQEFMH